MDKVQRLGKPIQNLTVETTTANRAAERPGAQKNGTNQKSGN
jgi:hypothetical protein